MNDLEIPTYKSRLDFVKPIQSKHCQRVAREEDPYQEKNSETVNEIPLAEMRMRKTNP
jgi:hypothetical protein